MKMDMGGVKLPRNPITAESFPKMSGVTKPAHGARAIAGVVVVLRDAQAGQQPVDQSGNISTLCAANPIPICHWNFVCWQLPWRLAIPSDPQMTVLVISGAGPSRSQNRIRRADELNRFPMFLGYSSTEPGLRNLFTIMKTHLRR